MDLSISTKDEFKIVKLAGKIDWENARLLDQQINSLIDQGFYHIVFDLNNITFICSGGIGALVYNLNKVKKSNGAIYLISANDYVNFIFETLKFDIVFDGFLFDSFDSFCSQIIDQGKEEK